MAICALKNCQFFDFWWGFAISNEIGIVYEQNMPFWQFLLKFGITALGLLLLSWLLWVVTHNVFIFYIYTPFLSKTTFGLRLLLVWDYFRYETTLVWDYFWVRLLLKDYFRSETTLVWDYFWARLLLKDYFRSETTLGRLLLNYYFNQDYFSVVRKLAPQKYPQWK